MDTANFRLLMVCAALAALAACSDTTSPTTATPEPDPVMEPDATEDTAEPDPVEDVDDPQPEPDIEEDAPEPSPDATEDVGEPDAPVVDPCDSFELVQARFGLLPLTSVDIAAQGGSGQYAWAFVQNNSGSILDELSGFYLSGESFGVADEVNVTDVVCERTFKATLEIYEPASLYPQEVEITPGQQVCFEVRGGSAPPDAEVSPYRWEIVQAGSGAEAEIDGQGCYTAGPRQGQDIVRLIDTNTDQRVTADVLILEVPRPMATNAPRLVLPEGESFPIAVDGGSGVFSFEVRDGDEIGVRVEEGRSQRLLDVRAGSEAGTVTIRVEDVLHQGLSTDVRVTVMARQKAVHTPYGIHSDDNDVLDAGDVNGDGHADVLVGVRAASFNGQNSGAAFLYLGGQPQEDETLGLGAEPAQIFTGQHRSSFVGRGMASGDFNNDGCTDLAIGAFGANTPTSQTGEVQLWLGCREGEPLRESWFGRVEDNAPPGSGQTPTRFWRRLIGPNAGDHFGYEMTTGDFDGDGRDDLAVTARLAESPEFRNPNNSLVASIGRIHIFLNRAQRGLDETPSLIIDGLSVGTDLSLTAIVSTEFGYRLDAADLNGDGCDDLLVGAPRADGYHGFTSLYTSIADQEAPNGCSLSPSPSLAIYPDDADRIRAGRLGWDVKMGDFNGDCVPDLVVAQSTGNVIGESSSSAGSVNIFFGDGTWHPDNLQRLSRLDADIILSGDRWDNFGWDTDVGDFDGDGIDDIVVGVRFGEHDGTTGDIGEVRIYRGLIDASACEGDEGAEAHFAEPLHLLNETYRNGDLFGGTLSLTGDVDGDGARDLVVHAPRGPAGDPEETQNHLGKVYWLPSGAESLTYEHLVPLDMPVVQSEEYVGWTVEAAGDLNADGFMDFAVGAPYWDRPETRDFGHVVSSAAGTVFIHFGGPDGVRAQPDLLLADHAHHTGFDLFGYGMTSAGDYNGDGHDDLAVAAPFEDLQAACVQCRVNNVYRSDVGVTYIYFGGAAFGGRFDGDPEEIPHLSTPDAVICGPPVNSQRVNRTIHGGFDMNNDGLDDLMMADWAWNGNRGRLYYAQAQPVTDGEQSVVCMDMDENLLEEGVVGSDFVGFAQTSGDVNGDGCDDLIAGAYNYDFDGRANAGAVMITLGWGARGCPTERIKVTLRGGRANENMGYGLAMADVDGDGIKDLAVGSTGIGPTNLNAVMVYRGQALRDALASITQDTELDLGGQLILGPLLDPNNASSQNFGVSIESIGDINSDGFEDLIVGAQLGRPGENIPTGAAYIYLGSDDVAQLFQADLIVAGESNIADGRFGWSVAGSRVNLRRDAAAAILVGAPFSDAPGPSLGEVGAAFIGLIE